MRPGAGIATGSAQSTHRSGPGIPLPYVQPIQDVLVKVLLRARLLETRFCIISGYEWSQPALDLVRDVKI
jgi:hypothetical protein